MTDTSTAPISSLCYCAAILLLGETVARGNALFDWPALLCATAAIVAVALPLCLPPIAVDRRLITASVASGIAIGFLRLPWLALFLDYPATRSMLMPFTVLSALAALLVLMMLIGQPRSLQSGIFALFLLDFGFMAWFHLSVSTAPQIDVYLVQQLGCDALIHGHNPFAMTFPDIYGPGAGFYPPGVVINGQVQSGYFYPPLSLLLDLPGFFLGDLRLAHLAAMLVAAAAIGFPCRRYTLGAWLLLTPRLLNILENAWIESYAVMLICLCVGAAKYRRQFLVPLILGLLLATKQYLPLTAAAAPLLLSAPWRSKSIVRFAVLVLIAGSAVTVPFLAWDPHAAVHSFTTLYTGIIRWNSISFLPVLSRVFGTQLTLLCPLLAAVPPSILVLWRGQRSAAGFAAGVALISLCVFAFSTQSFPNYYFFAIAALCAAMGDENFVGSSRQPSPPRYDGSAG